VLFVHCGACRQKPIGRMLQHCLVALDSLLFCCTHLCGAARACPPHLQMGGCAFSSTWTAAGLQQCHATTGFLCMSYARHELVSVFRGQQGFLSKASWTSVLVQAAPIGASQIPSLGARLGLRLVWLGTGFMQEAPAPADACVSLCSRRSAFVQLCRMLPSPCCRPALRRCSARVKKQGCTSGTRPRACCVHLSIHSFLSRVRTRVIHGSLTPFPTTLPAASVCVFRGVGAPCPQLCWCLRVLYRSCGPVS
jgi:hypothetical protein